MKRSVSRLVKSVLLCTILGCYSLSCTVDDSTTETTTQTGKQDDGKQNEGKQDENGNGQQSGDNGNGNGGQQQQGGDEGGNGGQQQGGGDSGNGGQQQQEEAKEVVVSIALNENNDFTKLFSTSSSSCKVTEIADEYGTTINLGSCYYKAGSHVAIYSSKNPKKMTVTPAADKTISKIEFEWVSDHAGVLNCLNVAGDLMQVTDSWEGEATADSPLTLNIGTSGYLTKITLTYGTGYRSGETGDNGGQQQQGGDENLGEETVDVISASDSSVSLVTEVYGQNNDKYQLVSASKGITTLSFVLNSGSKANQTNGTYRFYAGTDLKIVPPADKTLVKVEFTFSGSTYNGSTNLNVGPLNPNRGEYNADDYVWTGFATKDAPLIFSPEAVVWLSEVKVTYKAGVATPSSEIPPFEPAQITDFLAGSKGAYRVTYTGKGFTTEIDANGLHTTSLDENHELLFGNPTGAKTDRTNYLLKEEIGNYTISYNDFTHNPNWVAWHLAKADLWNGDKTIKRQDDFRANEKLPQSFYKVTNNDYSGSGFDQGHMLNSYDRLSSNAINSETFYMTNMVPQSGTCNRGTWKGLEDWEQKQAEAGKELYIVCGPYGQGGDTQKNGVAKLFKADYIDSKTDSNVHIVVPRYVWKILLILDEGTSDLSRVDASTEVIAIMLPNSTCVKGTSWTDYVCSVNYIEELTGYDFFANLDDSIEDALEAKVYSSK
ncbi:DNA/RNA non-specific endonuclease [uncultured Treponema sp.]|uniref:DNA/RNA non-specific endonuclease n=1 Tax=uncultured Treponema sp. TaxID=162155 RepID=UPI0025FB93CD|nr:DNA/RNA non-specific endonuclease [uncultured Treponema sp.]